MITASSFAVLAYLEHRIPVLKNPPGRRGGTWPVNLLLILLFQGLMLLFPALAPLAMAIFAEKFHLGLRHMVESDPMMGDLGFFAVGLLALDLAVYFNHWAFHRFSWLWPYHRVHHSESHLDVTSAFRFHPVEFLISTVVKGLVILLLGLSFWTVFVFEVALSLMAMLTHSNIRLPWGVDRNLSKLIVTPNFHRVHHHKHSMTTNYGTIFSFWDHLFSTFRDYSVQEMDNFEIGLTEPVPAERIDQLLVQPWLERSGR